MDYEYKIENVYDFNFQISDGSRALVLQILGTNTSDGNTLCKGSCVLRHEFQNNYTTLA